MGSRKDTPLSLGERLKKDLKKKGISQRSLAEKLGGSWTAPKVSEIVSGKRGLTIRSALDIEEILEIPAENLLKCQMENKLWEERRRRKDV
jgi:plasmid maintenance system antidote protein VapI